LKKFSDRGSGLRKSSVDFRVFQVGKGKVFRVEAHSHVDLVDAERKKIFVSWIVDW
jgi:hypothetical protein